MEIIKGFFTVCLISFLLFNNLYANEKFDIKKAEKFCTMGIGKSCYKLAFYYIEERKDDVHGIFYLTKGCNFGDDISCGLLGTFYSHPEVLRANYENAYKIFSKLIKSAKTKKGKIIGNQGLAELYENGWYVKKDLFKAFSFYQKACELNFSRACIKVGDFYSQGIGTRLNFDKALEYYGKACDMENQEGCSKYASLKKRMMYLKNKKP